jgi:uracil-DNA glycosylase
MVKVGEGSILMKQAGSHSNRGWESFTAAILRVITSRLTPTENTGAHGVVFMAWGKHAQTMISGVDKVSPSLFLSHCR